MSTSASGTVVKPCRGGTVGFAISANAGAYMTKHMACISPFQDALYGHGNRLHNRQGAKNQGHERCTVCGSGYGLVRP